MKGVLKYKLHIMNVCIQECMHHLLMYDTFKSSAKPDKDDFLKISRPIFF
jgi:hypothetical protein